MRYLSLCPVLLVLYAIFLGNISAKTIVVDGDDSDWNNIKPIAHDVGDTAASQLEYDIEYVYITHDESAIYFLCMVDYKEPWHDFVINIYLNGDNSPDYQFWTTYDLEMAKEAGIVEIKLPFSKLNATESDLEKIEFSIDWFFLENNVMIQQDFVHKKTYDVQSGENLEYSKIAVTATDYYEIFTKIWGILLILLISVGLTCSYTFLKEKRTQIKILSYSFSLIFISWFIFTIPYTWSHLDLLKDYLAVLALSLSPAIYLEFTRVFKSLSHQNYLFLAISLPLIECLGFLGFIVISFFTIFSYILLLIAKIPAKITNYSSS